MASERPARTRAIDALSRIIEATTDLDRDDADLAAEAAVDDLMEAVGEEWGLGEPAPDPEAAEGEPIISRKDIEQWLLGMEKIESDPHTRLMYIYAAGVVRSEVKLRDRLRARVQPDTVLMTWCAACGKPFPAHEVEEEDTCPRCNAEGCLMDHFELPARVQPRTVSREQLHAVTREIAEGYRTHAGADEIAVDVLDILGIEITPPEGGEDDETT